MALTETTNIKSVTININTNEIFVVKETKIFRDDEEVTSTTSNRYFSESEKSDFIKEVPGAENYISVMGW